MKTFALTLFVCGCSLAVSGQNLFIDTAKQNYINDSLGGYSSMLGLKNMQEDGLQWFNVGEDNAEENFFNKGKFLSVFKLDTISLSDFTKYKKKYKPEINKDSSKVKWTDTSFTIKFDNTERTFVANQNDYSFFEYYLGLLEPLNLYMVHGVDGHNEIGWMELIDKKTGKAYVFESLSDYPIENLCISPKYSYLLGYVNDLYDGRCFISLLKINRKKNTYTLNDFYGINMEKTHCKELVWIDENSFAIAADDTYTYDTVAPKYYLRISFK